MPLPHQLGLAHSHLLLHDDAARHRQVAVEPRVPEAAAVRLHVELSDPARAGGAGGARLDAKVGGVGVAADDLQGAGGGGGGAVGTTDGEGDECGCVPRVEVLAAGLGVAGGLGGKPGVGAYEILTFTLPSQTSDSESLMKSGPSRVIRLAQLWKGVGEAVKCAQAERASESSASDIAAEGAVFCLCTEAQVSCFVFCV